MKASDYIAATLSRKGVRAVFELSGGMITHLLDSLHRFNEIEIISMHHEQGAAFAAEGMGRITGVPGVAMATSGPGATNLLTGVGSCYFDSTPAVFITGQVNRNEQKRDRAIRQLGFQETDIVPMVRPITKHAWKIGDVEELPSVLDDAFDLAVSGRPGPVLIDIPMDVQRCEVNAEPARAIRHEPQSAMSEADCGAIWEAFIRARKPLILAGGGIRSGLVIRAFRDLVQASGIPVVHSLMAVDVLPYDDPLNVGMIGSYGNRWANLALHQSDCILVVGSRLDVRQTGAEASAFKGDRPIFHIDCEAGEVNNRVTGCHAVMSELRPALARLMGVLAPVRVAEWLAEISRLRQMWPDTAELRDVAGINPNVLMHQVSRGSSAAAGFVVDVGQHQMWAAQSLELTGEQRFLTSGGMGSMGFALPAAVGATIGAGRKPMVVVVGDGAFQCNIQELQTAVRLQLPLKIVVLNNLSHGMVRQFQESYFEGRYQSTMWGYSAPDFTRVAEAYGIRARTIAKPASVAEAVEWLWAEPLAPSLLHVMISPLANAYPKLAFGRTMDQMEPHATPLDMEGT